MNVSPVFFYVNQSKISNNLYKHVLIQDFGHMEKGYAYKIAVPYIGVEKGKTGRGYIDPLTDQTDKSAYLAETMQQAREDIANQIVANKDPQGIQNF